MSKGKASGRLAVKQVIAVDPATYAALQEYAASSGLALPELVKRMWALWMSIDQAHERGKAQRFWTRACERDTLRKAGAWTAIFINQEFRSCLY